VLKTLGGFFFRFRNILPIPLVLGLIKGARPKKIGWMLGLPLVISGEALRLWALMHIGPTTRTRKVCADRLVTSGPYTLTRNPLYLANLLKVTGLLVIAGDLPLALISLIFYGAEFSCLVPFEEAFLRQTFGDEHRLYTEQVPAFFPDGRRFDNPATPAFSFREALVSERKTFGSTGLILGLLAYLTGFRAGAASSLQEGSSV